MTGTKSFLADLHFHVTDDVKMMVGALLLLSVCVLPPIEILMVGSVGLVLAQLLRLLFNAAPLQLEGKTKPQLHRCSPAKREKTPPKNSGSVVARDNRLRVPPNPGITLDNDAASLDAAVSAACVSLAAAQQRAGGKSLPPPVASEALLAKLGPGLLGGPPTSSAVLDAVTSAIYAALPCARVYDAGEAGAGLEIVIVAESHALATLLRDRLRRGVRSGERLPLGSSKLQKSALRYCINLLVAKGFKFRRSAFKADEPAVSLNAPDALSGGKSITVNLSVNNLLPLLNGALVYEASAADPRALPLITSVHRWAEARGLAHASFGPLSAYAWTHVAIYFLQEVAEPRMPALGGEEGKVTTGLPDGKLLSSFFKFCSSFAWGEKSIFINGSSPSPGILVEDVFRNGVELGTCLQNGQSVERLQSEAALAASKLAVPDATVADLLERPTVYGNRSAPPGLPEPLEMEAAELTLEELTPLEPPLVTKAPVTQPVNSAIPPWRLRAG